MQEVRSPVSVSITTVCFSDAIPADQPSGQQFLDDPSINSFWCQRAKRKVLTQPTESRGWSAGITGTTRKLTLACDS